MIQISRPPRKRSPRQTAKYTPPLRPLNGRAYPDLRTSLSTVPNIGHVVTATANQQPSHQNNIKWRKCFDSMAATVYILGGARNADVHDLHAMRSLRHVRSRPVMVYPLPEAETNL